MFLSQRFLFSRYFLASLSPRCHYEGKRERSNLFICEQNRSHLSSNLALFAHRRLITRWSHGDTEAASFYHGPPLQGVDTQFVGDWERYLSSHFALAEGACFANSLTKGVKPVGWRLRKSNRAFIWNLIVLRRGVFEVEDIRGVWRSVLRSVVLSLFRPLFVGPTSLFWAIQRKRRGGYNGRNSRS